MHEIEVRHQGLNKYRLIRNRDYNAAIQMAQAQVAQWDEMWAKRQATESLMRSKDEKKALAASRNSEAQQTYSLLQSLLADGAKSAKPLDWNELKDKSRFVLPKPNLPMPTKPVEKIHPPRPRFQAPELELIDKIFRKKAMLKELAAKEMFDSASKNWETEVKRIGLENATAEAEFKNRIEEHRLAQIATESEWNSKKAAFGAHQQKQHSEIDALQQAYLSFDEQAITSYVETILSRSSYPEFFPKSFVVQYFSEAKVVAIELRLPAPEDIPKVKEVKYVATSDKLVEVNFSDSAFAGLYDSILYQIILRAVSEIYTADSISAFESLAINGWVHSIDAGTGKEINPCVLSIVVSKADFEALDFTKVDPKVCFKKLKGVGSSKLVGLAAVPPILMLNRDDARFVSSYGVVSDLDEKTNLAAMDWEDFEHLVRELFEKEFAKNGGEVKVTQASRDGGVDAIAFDPDPIRGGKIVIQAKRYTNVVGVSSVRDLYGTLMNEGANKGILVTTSQFGPDAYEFAKGKPITLLNGQNLLFLLAQHGYKARIDISEARKFL